MTSANNVTRLLDARKIANLALEIPTEKLSALQVADYLNVPPDMVYKTIVFKRAGEGKGVLALVAAPLEVDAKKLAAALSEKKVLLTTQREAEQITGLLSGGISPLALINKGFQVVIDAPAQELEAIIISAGQRGLQVRLNPQDLARLTGARFASVSE
jgi:Cys-tRNA(Pro)/Cys-tRNA(Cys) deacylase